MSADPSPSPFPAGIEPPVSEGGPRWKAIILGLGALLLLIGGLKMFGGREEKLARMSASEARVTVAGSAEAPVTEIERGKDPEVYYRVVLHDAPLGGRLQLGCEWLDPSGQVARRNRYQTRFVYKSTWPTHCRQRFDPAAPAGEWRVRLLLGDRILSGSSFVLR